MASQTAETDATRTLELLGQIESLGGSAGYQKDPAAFASLVAEVDPLNSQPLEKAIGEIEKDVGALPPIDGESSSSVELAKEGIIKMEALEKKDPEAAQGQRALQVLQGIELLGGSVGFQEYISNSVAPEGIVAESVNTFNLQANSDEWSTCTATGIIAAGFVATSLTIWADGHNSTGVAWGLGLGFGGFAGVFHHAPWHVLKSGTNKFYIEAVGGQSAVRFTLNGERVGTLVSANLGALVTTGSEGKFDWK
ncbi:hypothetical protein JAAARDRAFT_62035 [Jaapia argillacea MUCL 33604]|uniref:Uncharacterized protein n=1 Tax=Jaapia argillacea MUCL 33604 TaxID=933084 RepID=A0A067PM56_9AGAM|nr:hypothetical protein JAAARDRAFT_62035 [Jaapia argillacea MUCL 33604]